ncbi:Zcf27p [Neophaeococcomyces mojaviensis]|uniref:Zcf27p n=1 Tax=Neophaeococcomyces mojaviensis TaxID=3383035 RepID=A0ACC3ADG3_9EURO|nr:Zcf27p [Knufia sp. JES_112]
MAEIPGQGQESQSHSAQIRVNKRPAPRGTAAYPRKRAVTACQVCRARRTKCDNRKPSCSFCLKVGAQCVQSSVDLSSFDPASLRILERLDDLETVLKSALPATSTKIIESPESQLVSNQGCLPSYALLPAELEDVFASFELHQPSLPHDTVLLATLKDAAGESPSFPATSPAAAFADLEPQTTRALLDRFFQYCHIKNPVLTDEDFIRRVVAKVSLNGVEWSGESCLTLLICALGSISTPFGDSDSTTPGSESFVTSQAYFQAAQKRLGTVVGNAGVLSAQCLFFAGVYMMCIFKPNNAWRFFSQALACCQEFDLITHNAALWKDTEAFEMYSSPQRLSAAEQAIYWSSWKSERELRISLRPYDFHIPSSDQSLYPSFFPTPPTQEQTPGVGDRHEYMHIVRQQQKAWYYYLTEISLRRLAARITDAILNCPLRPGQSQIVALAALVPQHETSISQWMKSLPQELSLSNAKEHDDVCIFVLRGMLVNLYELVYWPFLHSHLEHLNGANAADHLESYLLEEPEMSDHIRRLAGTALRVHVERIEVNRPGFRHRHHGTWLMIRTCTRSALMLIKTALLLQQTASFAHDSVSMPAGWRQAVTDTIALNRHWTAEAVDCRKNLPILENLWALTQATTDGL